MQIHPILRKKWFWISLVLLIVFALIFDFTVAGLVLYKNIAGGKWSATLLELGLLYSGIKVYSSYLQKPERSQIKLFGRVVLVIIAFLAFKGYGFWQGFNFIITVLIFSNLVRWITHRIYKKKKEIKAEWI